MKNFTNLLGLISLLFIASCASTNEIVSDTTKRPPTGSVEVFKEERVPSKRFKEIAELSFLGPREEELRAQKYFIKRAKKFGGNGVIFSMVHEEKRGTFGLEAAWVFKGKVIVYE